MPPDSLSSVLIVDDMPDNLQLLMAALQDEYAILAAKDGKRALALARAEPRPDIILLDVMMPDMDGYAVCRHLKGDPATRDIPVIFVTARDATDDEEQGLALGAVDYIVKPFHPGIVKARVRNHLELQKSRQQLLQLWRCVEDGPAAIVITDVDGKPLYCNPACRQMTGYSLEEAAGMEINPLLPQAPDAWPAAREGRSWSGDISALRKNGESYWEHVTLSPIRNATGRIVNFLLIREDISSRKDLERLKEDVERIMRHDLKGPLNGIVALTRVVLEENDLNPGQKEMIGLIEDSGSRALRMIDMSLDLYKMETGAYAYVPRDVDAAAVIGNVVSTLAPKFIGKGVRAETTLDLGPPAPLRVRADETLLHSMLFNLIQNAFEASPPDDHIVIALSSGPEPRIVIRNKGAVPKAIRDRFFEKYTTHGKRFGTGLGAYSARLLAETMHCKLELDVSDDDDTTTITVIGVAGEMS